MTIKSIHLQLISLILFSLTTTSVQSLDIITMAAGSATTHFISKITSWIFSPSKTDEEYAMRDQQLKFRTKDEFLEEIASLKKIGGFSPEMVLCQHELYRYPNFLAAIKEAFPEYTEYVKKLFNHLSECYEARVVKGFKVERKGYLGLRHLRGVRAYDYFEFYELIKELSGQIMEEEVFAPPQKNSPHQDGNHSTK